MKRAIDAMGSLCALLLFGPLMLAIACAVRWTSPGPALFRQQRLGLHGEPFEILKFRTMYSGAPDLRNADGSTYNGPTDARVTRLGRWLRATSCDELPQLINVLRGDMSLVGPRPDQVDQLRYYAAGEEIRLDVRPGVTGLAQLSGRNGIAWEERKRLDAEYVQRRSLWLDLSILFRTIPYVLTRKGIYSRQEAEKRGGAASQSA